MILGVDIGGTCVKMGLVDRSGVLHARHEASVCFDGYQTPILTTVIHQARGFLQQTGAEVQGIGVSATGQIDEALGMVAGTNGKIPHYEGAQIRRSMEAALGKTVWVLNDANAAVLGECFAGRGKRFRHVLMVTLGTGVGGGIVLDGQRLSGARGLAGEIGHFTLYQNGMPCACGKRGCFENYASTSALVRLVQEKRGALLSGREIFVQAANGDGKVQDALNSWMDDIAAGITGLVHLLNPEIVLIGGGVSVQEELLIAPLRKRILQGVMPRFAEGLRVASAALGNDAGMIGAARYCMERQEMQQCRQTSYSFATLEAKG